MKELIAYVDSKNKWGAIFGSPALDLNSAADRKKLASEIDCDLSPENLTCDGELTRSQVQAKYNRLIKVATQLKKLDPSVTMYEFA